MSCGDNEVAMKTAHQKSEFPHLKGEVIYLDNAGTSLYTKSQLEAFVTDANAKLYGNPHTRGNQSGTRCQATVELAREGVKQRFGCPKNDTVIFTSGATAACKLVAEMLFSQSDNRKGSFIYLFDNHTSIVGMRDIATRLGHKVGCLVLTEDGDPFCFDDYVIKEISACDNPEDFRLFAFPAQSNFSGIKYPTEDWCCQWSDDESYTLVDVASLVSTSAFNFKESGADFACLSFYKIFGFPTGLGCLLIRERMTEKLIGNKPSYFGGGSVDAYLPTSTFQRPRNNLHLRYETGTIDFMGIAALEHSWQAHHRIGGSMEQIQVKTMQLAAAASSALLKLKHYNNLPVVQIHSAAGFKDHSRQGPIIAFTIRDSRGLVVGHNMVVDQLDARHVHVRGGCMCNSGACVWWLDGGDHSRALNNYKLKGHRCGGDSDVIDGKPTGVVRASFGYFNTYDDVTRFVGVVEELFAVTKPLPELATSSSTTATIRSITVYPIKSCRGVKVTSSWPVDNTTGALRYDRQWVIVERDTLKAVTSKRHRAVTTIQPEVFDDDGVDRLRIVIEGDSQVLRGDGDAVMKVGMCGRKVDVRWCGDEQMDNFLTRHLGTCVQLCQQLDSKILANQAQFLIIARPSCRLLARLVDDSEHRADDLAERFRANVLMDGVEPLDEESWSRIECADFAFESESLCRRCEVITHGSSTSSDRPELLRKLRFLPPPSTATSGGQQRTSFGVYMRLVVAGEAVFIRVGQEMTITRR